MACSSGVDGLSMKMSRPSHVYCTKLERRDICPSRDGKGAQLVCSRSVWDKFKLKRGGFGSESVSKTPTRPSSVPNAKRPLMTGC